MTWEVRTGDCVELMRSMSDASVDAVVCDPPYGLEFMGKDWDRLGFGWESSIGKTGYTDAERMPRPNFGSTRNPMCRICRKHQRGRDRCECGTPDFDQTPADANRRMQDWHHAWATEALRVLRPGGHLLAFGGTRTSHRLACAVEDAGFEIRDTICWLYGSGFPKSLDVSKAIDRARDDSLARGDVAEWLRPYVEAYGFEALTTHFGFLDQTMARARWTTRSQPQTPTLEQWVELKSLLSLPDDMDAEVWRLNGRKGQPGENWELREKVGEGYRVDRHEGAVPYGSGTSDGAYDITAPATPEAEQWQGWGTALKPSHEPVVVARKPLSGTVAQNVLEHGTGALNVNGCRVGTDDDLNGGAYSGQERRRDEYSSTDSAPGAEPLSRLNRGIGDFEPPAGRWPANVVLDEEAARLLDEQTGELIPGTFSGGQGLGYHGGDAPRGVPGYGDSGGASRFFYVAKASRAERNAGLEGFEGAITDDGRDTPIDNPYLRGETKRQNVHPTVKPIELMRWLIRLITPPGSTVLDPFAGSGTTGCACALEGFDFVGLEREQEYVDIARARIAWWHKHRGDGEAAAVLAAGSERDAVEATGQLGMFEDVR